MLLHLLFYVLIIGLVFYLLNYLVGIIPLPAPFAVVAKVILGVAAIIILLELILPLAGPCTSRMLC